MIRHPKCEVNNTHKDILNISTSSIITSKYIFKGILKCMPLILNKGDYYDNSKKIKDYM